MMFKFDIQARKNEYLGVKETLEKHKKRIPVLLQNYKEQENLINGVHTALSNSSIGAVADRKKLIVGAKYLLILAKRDYDIEMKRRQAAVNMKTSTPDLVSKAEKFIIVSTEKEISKIRESAQKESRTHKKDDNGFKLKDYADAEAKLIAMFIEKYKDKINPNYPYKLTDDMISALLNAQKELNAILITQEGKACAEDVAHLSF